MSHIPIIELRVDDLALLRVIPDLPLSADYASIYRDASSVRWDEDSRSLYTLPVKDWTSIDCYKQILSAVANEYGDQLVLTPNTLLTRIPADVENEIRSLGNGSGEH